jgi:hypothetical protein
VSDLEERVKKASADDEATLREVAQGNRQAVDAWERALADVQAMANKVAIAARDKPLAFNAALEEQRTSTFRTEGWLRKVQVENVKVVHTQPERFTVALGSRDRRTIRLRSLRQETTSGSTQPRSGAMAYTLAWSTANSFPNPRQRWR